MKGFLELKQEGRIRSLPRMIGVQAEGCGPLADAFARGRTDVVPCRHPRTIAQAISNPHPPAGKIVLHWTRLSKGTLLAVSDDDMLKAQRRLAEEEGLFCLPDSATTAAALMKFRSLFSAAEPTVVLLLTGTGLKNLHLFDASPSPLLRAEVDALDEAVASALSS